MAARVPVARSALPRLIGAVAGALLLAAAFRAPLAALARLAFSSELYSYIPLIPVVSLVLAALKRRHLAVSPPPRIGWLASFSLAAVGAVLAYRLGAWQGWMASDPTGLTASLLLAWVAIAAVGIAAAGRSGAGSLIFPLGFLLFCLPLPGWLFASAQGFLQQASASVAGVMFTAALTPFRQDGLFFVFSDITIEVAPECSGFHSTFILLITSVLGAHLFLRSRWRQAVLILAVLPLALLRNGFRIFVIGQLCVQFGPRLIDSYIHHHGGPIFFAASLLPFFYLLQRLRKSEG